MKSTKKCILVVEDDESRNAAIARDLEALGYEAFTVHNGEDALGHILQNRHQFSCEFDAILANVITPVFTGIELARTVKFALLMTTPVVLMADPAQTLPKDATHAEFVRISNAIIYAASENGLGFTPSLEEVFKGIFKS